MIKDFRRDGDLVRIVPCNSLGANEFSSTDFYYKIRELSEDFTLDMVFDLSGVTRLSTLMAVCITGIRSVAHRDGKNLQIIPPNNRSAARMIQAAGLETIT